MATASSKAHQARRRRRDTQSQALRDSGTERPEDWASASRPAAQRPTSSAISSECRPGAPKRFISLGRHGAITPDEARTRARAALGAVAAGQDPALDRKHAQAAITCSELANLFLEEHVGPKRKVHTAKGYGAVLRSNFLPALGKRKAELVTTAEIAKLHLSLRDRPYQANRLLAIIGSMYTFAAPGGVWCPAD